MTRDYSIPPPPSSVNSTYGTILSTPTSTSHSLHGGGHKVHLDALAAVEGHALRRHAEARVDLGQREQRVHLQRAGGQAGLAGKEARYP
mgnify:CR=1 FL=1